MMEARAAVFPEKSHLLSVSASQLPSVDTQSSSYILQKAGHCARWANPGTNYMVGPRLRVLPMVRWAPGQAQAGDSETFMWESLYGASIKAIAS